MKATEEKQFLYSIRLPRVRAVAAFLLLFYVLADVTVIEYLSGNAALGIPAYNKVVALDSTAPPLVEGNTNSVQTSPNEFYLTGTHKSESASDDDNCFLCCTHILLGYNGINAAAAAASLPVVAQKNSAFFPHRQRHSDSHPSPFYRPPRSV